MNLFISYCCDFGFALVFNLLISVTVLVAEGNHSTADFMAYIQIFSIELNREIITNLLLFTGQLV